MSHKKLSILTKFFVIVILVVCNAKLIIAQTYSYFPNVGFTLGNGIDLRDIQDGKACPLKFPLAPHDNSTGSVQTSFNESIITSQEDLEKSYKLDANLEARYLTFSASANYNIDEKELLKQSSLTILISGESNFGTKTLQIDQSNLTDIAHQLILDKKYDDFINMYGNYLVTGVELVSRVNIYITITNVESSTKQSISEGAEAKGSYGPFSASASVNINSELSKASKNNNITINIQSNGDATGFAGLKGLISTALTQNDPLASISAQIQNYLSGFTKDNSPIDKYYLSSMSMFGVPKNNLYWNQSTEHYLADIYNKYKKLSKLKDEIEDLSNDVSFKHLANPQDQQELTNESDSVNARLEALYNKEDQCLNQCQPSVTACCNTDNITIPSTPIFNINSSFLSQFNTVSEHPFFIPVHGQSDILNVNAPIIQGRHCKIYIKLYCIPVPAVSLPEQVSYQGNVSSPAPVLNLLINGVVVRQNLSLERPTVAPAPYIDSQGNITGYTNYFIFSVDDYLITGPSLKISFAYQGVQNNNLQTDTPPFANFLKFHPGVSLKVDFIQ